MSEPSVSLVHQINPSNAQQASLALAETNLLKEVISTFVYNPKTSVWCYLNWLPKKLRSLITVELSRRSWISDNRLRIKTYPWREIIRILLSRNKLVKTLFFRDVDLVSWVDIFLDDKVAKYHLQGINAIYSYEDMAATTFKKAKEKGII